MPEKFHSPFINNKNLDSECVIINLCEGSISFVELAEGLIKQWQGGHNTKAYLLNLKEFLEKKLIFEACSDKKHIKIYIIGHCNVGLSYLSNKKNNASLNVDYRELASALIHYVGQHDAIVNLIACFAGQGSNPEENDSFAECLYQLLYQKNPNISVIARTAEMNLAQGKKKTVKIGKEKDYEYFARQRDSLPPGESQQLLSDRLFEEFSASHQYGSKIIFRKRGNQPICADAYANKWRASLLEYIDEAKTQTANQQKKQIFEKWQNQFDSLTDKNILLTIKKELSNQASPFRKNDLLLFNFFGRNSTEYYKLKLLMEKGKNIINSPFTQTTRTLKNFTN